MGGNHFYSNAEAYAYEILQQKLIKEAQRTAQQTVIELSALRTLFNQGQFLYCIPFGGVGLGQNIPLSPYPPYPNICPMEQNFALPDAYYHPFPASQTQPPAPPSQPPQSTPPCPHPPTHNLLNSQTHNNNNNIINNSNNNTNNNNNNINNSNINNNNTNNNNNKMSVIHLNLKNQSKTVTPRSGLDECNLGKEGFEVSIDLREYIPAEIQINVEERCIEIKAYHVSEVGSKTFSRRYDLPACIVLDSVRCILSHDGYLILSAAWMKME